MNQASSLLPVASILFGFLFAAFWWSLNRELTFHEDDRHFKLAYLLLLLSMLLLGYFGIVLPLQSLALADTSLLSSLRGIVLALLGVFGYMLTELGHYKIYQKPKYMRDPEKVLFAVTLLLITGLAVAWWIV